MITVSNHELVVTIDPSLGGEIRQIAFGDDPLLAFGGWDAPVAVSRSSTYGDPKLDWLSEYQGGWQLLVPNAGAACVVDGVPLPFHGEWSRTRVDVTELVPGRVTMRAGTRLPFVVVRTVEVLDRPTRVRVTHHDRERVRPAAQPFVWGEHPAFLVGPGDVIDLPRRTGGRRGSRPTRCARGRRARHRARRASGRERALPAPTGLPGGPRCAGRTSGWRWRGTLDDFAHLWLWHEIGSTGFPFYGRTSIVAIEPASTWPGDGLAVAVERGQAHWLDGGAHRTASVTIMPFRPDGRAVVAADQHGTIRFEGDPVTIAHDAPKGFPLHGDARTGWNIFDADVPYPVAVMFESAIEHNSATMRRVLRAARRVARSARQDDDVARALPPTAPRRRMGDHRRHHLAGADDARRRRRPCAHRERGRGAGRDRVAGRRSMAEGFEVYCYVDSVAGRRHPPRHARTRRRRRAAARVRRARHRRWPHRCAHGRGRDGGRRGGPPLTAPRASPASAASTASSAPSATAPRARWSTSSSIGSSRSPRASPPRAGSSRRREVIVTAGGSVYFDHVVDRFRRARIDAPHRVVIRSGCYISHDDGALHAASPMGEQPRTDHDERLQPAIEVWGVVLSRPEPTRAVVGIGKRDVVHRRPAAAREEGAAPRQHRERARPAAPRGAGPRPALLPRPRPVRPARRGRPRRVRHLAPVHHVRQVAGDPDRRRRTTTSSRSPTRCSEPGRRSPVSTWRRARTGTSVGGGAGTPAR